MCLVHCVVWRVLNPSGTLCICYFGVATLKPIRYIAPQFLSGSSHRHQTRPGTEFANISTAQPVEPSHVYGILRITSPNMKHKSIDVEVKNRLTQDVVVRESVIPMVAPAWRLLFHRYYSKPISDKGPRSHGPVNVIMTTLEITMPKHHD